MRARKAKPRPTGTREAGNRVSEGEHPFPHELKPLRPHPGPVLPKPGFRCLLPGGEKSGLASSTIDSHAGRPSLFPAAA